MSIRLTKPWLPLDAQHVNSLPGQLGVYEIGDDSGEVIFIGMAGGRSRFGLRGTLQDELARRGADVRFRVEVNMQYQTRHRELLMAHVAAHGRLPRDNDGRTRLGRLSPA